MPPRRPRRARARAANIGSGSNRKNRIAAPVVADGRVHHRRGHRRHRDLDKRCHAWTSDLTASFDKGGGQSAGGLATAGNRVFATTGYGELVSLDAASGAILWRQRVDAPISEPRRPMAARSMSLAWMARPGRRSEWQGDLAAVGTPGKTAYVGTAAPSIGDRAVVFPSAAGDLMVVLKIGGGTKIWQVSPRASGSAAPMR